MKNKILKGLLMILASIFMPSLVFAASSSISASKTSAYVGESVTVTVNCFAGTWNLTVSGAVSDTIVGFDMDRNVSCSKSYTLNASSPTTKTVSLSGDITDYDTEVTSYPSGSVTVTFTERPSDPTPTPSPSPTPSTPSNNSGSNNNSNNNNKSSNNNSSSQTNDGKSSNNKIKELKAEGYELVKVDNNSYTLSVNSEVSSITIKVTAEDSKAKVTGIGKHDLKVGENNIEVIVTAENGSQNKITIKVTKKEVNTIEDLDSLLKESKNKSVDVVAKDDTILTKEQIEAIKNSGKTVNLIYNDSEGNPSYIVSIDGSKITAVNQLNPSITFVSDNAKEIAKLSNYADGIIVNFSENGDMPGKTTIKINVKNKYSDGDLVNIYYYDNNKLILSKENVTVKNGYVEFETDNFHDYFLTMSTINKIEKPVVTNEGGINNAFYCVIVIVALGVIGFLIYFFIKKNKKKNNNNSNNISNNSSEQTNVDSQY